MKFRFPIHILGLAVAGAVCLLSQDPGVVFRSDVALIRVDAEAVDASGAVLEGLQKTDFQLSDEGLVQPVLNFSFEEEPLDLIFLFDISHSMRGKLLSVVRAVELGFHELRKGDRACVMAFDAGAVELAPFTANLDAVNQTIVIKVPGLRFGGNSNLPQAARDAALRFRREPKSARRRAVLVVTDKMAGDKIPEPGLVRDLWQSDAVLSELVLGNASTTQVSDRAAGGVAAKTGGAVVVAGDPGDSFQKAVRLLRRRYTLYYASPGGQPGAERRIDVHLSQDAVKRFPGAQVRARSGYIVPAQ